VQQSRIEVVFVFRDELGERCFIVGPSSLTQAVHGRDEARLNEARTFEHRPSWFCRPLKSSPFATKAT
jgi:hypothetical protein